MTTPSRIYINFGASVGTAVAAVISWSVNHSVGWAILHAMFSWFYILYYLFVS